MVVGRAHDLVFARASVIIRFGLFIGVTLLIIIGDMPGPTLMFGILDVAGALWTRSALKR